MSHSSQISERPQLIDKLRQLCVDVLSIRCIYQIAVANIGAFEETPHSLGKLVLWVIDLFCSLGTYKLTWDYSCSGALTARGGMEAAANQKDGASRTHL